MVLPLVAFMISGCEKEKEDPSVTLGAQANATVPGFYSVSLDKTYTMSQAADNTGVIDILCFYEAETGNNIALASPGSGITGMFKGDDILVAGCRHKDITTGKGIIDGIDLKSFHGCL